MAQQILMVRHGQASYGAEDYDNLSPLGRQQSFWLGQHLNQLGFEPSLAIQGSLKRHAQTLAEISKSLPLVKQITDDAFIEISMTNIVEGYRKKYSDLPDYENDINLMNRAMGMVLTAWIGNEFEADELPWADFTAQVVKGLENLKSHGENILLITSGGTITAAVGAAQNLNAQAQVSMMLRIHNSSMTKLVRTPTNFELHSLNNVPHMETADRKASLTYV